MKKRRRQSKEGSGLTTTHKVLILVAIIGVLGYFVGGPAYDTMVQERAIIEISFGEAKEYPKSELQFDGANYFVEIVGINRGESQTNISVTVVSEGANVSFNKVNWSDKETQSLLFRPSEKPYFYTVYVQPNKNSDTFSLQLIVPQQIVIHDVFPVNPLNLVFQNLDGNYKMIRAF